MVRPWVWYALAVFFCIGAVILDSSGSSAWELFVPIGAFLFLIGNCVAISESTGDIRSLVFAMGWTSAWFFLAALWAFWMDAAWLGYIVLVLIAVQVMFGVWKFYTSEPLPPEPPESLTKSFGGDSSSRTVRPVDDDDPLGIRPYVNRK